MFKKTQYILKNLKLNLKYTQVDYCIVVFIIIMLMVWQMILAKFYMHDLKYIFEENHFLFPLSLNLMLQWWWSVSNYPPLG